MEVGKRLIRLPTVIQKVGLETSAIYERIAEGKFPAQVPIGRRAVAWDESEIDRWIAEQIAARDAAQKRPSAAS